MTRKSRRDFMRASSLLVASGAVPGGLGLARSADTVSAGAIPNGARSVHVLGRDLIRVGLVGCGQAGTAAVAAMLDTPGPVQLVGMADVFGDRIQTAYRQLRGLHAERVNVTREQRFVGLDAYRQLSAQPLDVVVLATPPSFRPLHFEAAVAHGKHAFLESPVAVDAPGVVRILQAAARAREQGLAAAVGMRHRYDGAYQETIARLQGGMIGEPVTLRVYRNGPLRRSQPRQTRQSELEYQLRNWSHFAWLSGDHLVESHIHNLDVGNWLLEATPVSANAQGGCCDGPAATSLDVQNFDQYFCEFSYANGVHMFSQCRRAHNCWNNVSEHAHGQSGRADVSGGKIYDMKGQRIWQTASPRSDRRRGYHEFIAALRRGELPHAVEPAARSTLTAVMGRMAARSGRVVTWDEAISSQETLADIDRLTSLDAPAPSPTAVESPKQAQV